MRLRRLPKIEMQIVGPIMAQDTRIDRLVTHSSVVTNRIERRLELLREWEAKGVPDGSFVPLNLTQARDWEAPEHGIQRIISPNEFTRTHPVTGELVTEIAQILMNLRSIIKRQAVPKRAVRREESTVAAENEKLRAYLVRAEQQLEATSRQWRNARDEIIDLKEQLDFAQQQVILKDQRIESQRREIEERSIEIKTLRRQSTSRSGFKVVE